MTAAAVTIDETKIRQKPEAPFQEAKQAVDLSQAERIVSVGRGIKAVENIAMAHPDVQMAACIGVAHPKWDERPIVVMVKKPDSTLDAATLLAFYQGKTAKWQIPDDVVFVEAIPLGATGKMLKTRLREQLADYRLPS